MRDRLRKIWLTDPDDIRKEKVRRLFGLYLVVIGIAEIFTFVLFWLFQVEEASPEMITDEIIPFHWKAYLLTAFLIPVLLTFAIGFISELKGKCDSIEQEKAERIKKIIWPYGYPGRKKIFLWLMAFTGFVFLMLILGFSDLGAHSFVPPELLVFLLVGIGALVFIVGLAVMIIKYKAKADALKAEYSKALARQLGFQGHDAGRM